MQKAYDNKVKGIQQDKATLNNVKEKEMMGGLTFMVNDKMCIGIIKDEMMCRIDPTLQEPLWKGPAAGSWILPAGL